MAAALVGAPLFPWQADVLRRAMAVDPTTRRLLHPEVALLCPRRNGKTQLLMARIIAGCLSEGESILYTAHLGDTARHMFGAFLELMGRSSWLQSQVAAEYHGKGDESILFHNGATFAIRARTSSGGRGMESDVLILDEGLEVRDDHMSALTPLLAKANAQGRGQMWIVSSAGHGKSNVLARYRDRGRAGVDPLLSFTEYAAARDADPADPATHAEANPSLGTAILSGEFLALQQASMTQEAFGREHLGWWTDEVASPFLPHGSWSASAQERPQPPARARVAFGVEVQDYGHAVLVAAVDLGSGRAWVEPLARWHDPLGLDPEQLAAAVLTHVRTVRPITVAADEFTCTTVLDHLEAAGVPVTRVNQPGLRAASQTLLTAVIGGRLPHAVDPATDAELEAVGAASTGDGLQRLSRKNSTGRSTAAFAVACAAHVILGPKPARPLIVTAR